MFTAKSPLLSLNTNDIISYPEDFVKQNPPGDINFFVGSVLHCRRHLISLAALDSFPSRGSLWDAALKPSP